MLERSIDGEWIVGVVQQLMWDLIWELGASEMDTYAHVCVCGPSPHTYHAITTTCAAQRGGTHIPPAKSWDQFAKLALTNIGQSILITFYLTN
jgi:hypothetical protein